MSEHETESGDTSHAICTEDTRFSNDTEYENIYAKYTWIIGTYMWRPCGAMGADDLGPPLFTYTARQSHGITLSVHPFGCV